jgi:16S rRNA (uracil1498-N3)-methyltransferase
MQYLHHPDAGAPRLTLEGDVYRYLIKVRRHRQGDVVALRSGTDENIHHYTIDSIERRTAVLILLHSEELLIAARRVLHIGWCMIDPKSIEKVLPTLNEIGVEQITFIDCDRSQKNFRHDPRRLQSILVNSSQQCGRSTPMRIDTAPDIATFLAAHPDAHLLQFSEHPLSCAAEVSTIIIGPEGGLSDTEISRFDSGHIVGLDTPMILRSESAAVAVASRIIL